MDDEQPIARKAVLLMASVESDLLELGLEKLGQDEGLVLFEWEVKEENTGAWFRHAVGLKHGVGANGWYSSDTWAGSVWVRGLEIEPAAVGFVEYIDECLWESEWLDRRAAILARRRSV